MIIIDIQRLMNKVLKFLYTSSIVLFYFPDQTSKMCFDLKDSIKALLLSS